MLRRIIYYLLLLTLIFMLSCKKDPVSSEDPTSGTMTDYDGNEYKTVKIGDQWWMAENLKVTHYNDGTSILFVTSSSKWGKQTVGAYCYYDNDEDNADPYGALYNWYAVDDDSIAPAGWHVPTDAEWTELEDYLIANGYNHDCTTEDNKKAKSLASKIDGNSAINTGAVGNDLSKNNSSGFNAFPCGYRNVDGSFNNMGHYGYWWSSTVYNSAYAWFRGFCCSNSGFYRYHTYRQNGFSVRLIRD